jgi:hypothetical protein
MYRKERQESRKNAIGLGAELPAPQESDLFDLDQRPGEILRMQEQHQLAVGANLWLAIAEHARAVGFESIAGGEDVLDLIAEMVHATVGIALKEFGDRGVRTQRMQKFDLRVGQFNEDDRHAVVGLRLRSGDVRAEGVAIGLRRLVEIGDGDGDVVQLADHHSPNIRLRTVDAKASPLNGAAHVRVSGRTLA